MIPFQQLTKDSQILITTFPFWVPATKNPDGESIEQIKKNHGSFLKLPESIKNKLSSEETSEKIQEIGKRYNLELLQLADIARAIRSYYFGEIQLEDFPAILSREMRIDLPRAREISQIVIQRIIQDNSYEESYQAQLTKFPFSDALKKYPKLGEQLITGNHIKIKSFPDPVRPSIKNWISDYTSHLGYADHSSMDRGQYLFREENTRNLSANDRQKLAFILKAFDENSTVTVNINTKQIVFQTVNSNPNLPASKQESRIREQKIVNNIIPSTGENIPDAGYNIPASPARFAPPRSSRLNEARPVDRPDTNLQFSSPQKLPYEKIYQNQPFKITRPEKAEEETEEELPKNVVNLKGK